MDLKASAQHTYVTFSISLVKVSCMTETYNNGIGENRRHIPLIESQ